jgi:hypothetical protein
MIKKIWNLCANMKVNFWLIFSTSLILAVGSYFIKYNPKLFMPLNHALIQDWFAEYGQYQPGQVWWFFILLVLAFFLGITTFVCAIKRIGQLWPQKRQLGFRVFSVRMAPSLIHLCFLVILAGHFLSLIVGYEQIVPVELNHSITLSQGNIVQVISQHVERYTAPVAFQGIIKQCTVSLKMQSPETTEIRELSVLNPLYWRGMSIHLDIFSNSDSQKAAPPELKLIIKKDPGVVLVIPCFAVLCVLMLWYFPQRKKT